MNRKEALKLYRDSENNPQTLYKMADDLRRKRFGNKVELCSVVNAKSGNCSQDCKFCAQSAHNKASSPEYPLISSEDMLEASKMAAVNLAHGFGIVTSGDCIDGAKELPLICEAIKKIKAQGMINPDASLGRLTKDTARELKKAGLTRYHHNLETSRDFFPNICTTHSYDDRIQTIKIAKEEGLEVCCGGLFGLGEIIEHRIDFAFTLKELKVDSVPLNFLIPISETPFEDNPRLTPDEILMTIAIFRIILPDKHIKVCGGREANLGNRQKEIFACGASGMMIGGDLTQGGNAPEEDLKMLKELGLEPATPIGDRSCGPVPTF